MADDDGTTTSAFAELEGAMPRIAEAIKDLPEAVQGRAFDALVASLTGTATPTPPPASTQRTTSTRRKRQTKPATSGGGTASKRRAAVPITISKDLNLAPKGKKSFKDFAAEKKPTTQHDRNVVSVYWLSQTAGQPQVSAADVFTCYRHSGWKIPTNMANALAVTAHRKGFFDTTDLADIKLKPHGINRVEHELPEVKKA